MTFSHNSGNSQNCSKRRFDNERFSNDGCGKHFNKEIVYDTATNGGGGGGGELLLQQEPLMHSNNEEAIEDLRRKLSATDSAIRSINSKFLDDLAKYQAGMDMKISRLRGEVTRLTVALSEISGGKKQHLDSISAGLQLEGGTIPTAATTDGNFIGSTPMMNERGGVTPPPPPPLSPPNGRILTYGTVLLDPIILGLVFDFLGQGEGLFIAGVNHTWKYLYYKQMGGNIRTSHLAALKSITRLRFAHTHGLDVSTYSVRMGDKIRPLAWFAGHVARSDVCVHLAELAGTDTCKSYIGSGAASGGRLDILKELIENHRWKFGATVLHRAAEAPTQNVLKWFYDRRIGPWDQENKGKCLLHAACCGNIENAKFLLDVGSKWHQHTLISAACFNKIHFIRWCRSQGYSHYSFILLVLKALVYFVPPPSFLPPSLSFIFHANDAIYPITQSSQHRLPISIIFLSSFRVYHYYPTLTSLLPLRFLACVVIHG